MASAKDQMKMIETELARVRNEIEKLRVEEALLVKMINRMSGIAEVELEPRQTRTRSPSVKPVVIDVVRAAGHNGVTTVEADTLVREKVPTVARDTVGSVLSRLKGDGALVYVGERYYEKSFAPKDDPNPFERSLRAVG